VHVIEARGLHVYPGTIDSATEIGLTEIGAVRETSDTNELGSLNPQLRPAVAVNPASEHIPVTRANGVTTVMTLPQGTMLAGQAALIHLDGWTSEEMPFVPDAAMMLHFPIVQISHSRFSRGNPAAYPEAKKTFEQQIRDLEEFFESARRYQKARQAHAPGFTTDLKFEAMLPLLEGKIR